MKTAEDYIYDFWTDNIDEEIGSENWLMLIGAIKHYSTLVAKEALKNASESAKTTQTHSSDGIFDVYKTVVDKQSILNESNIPKL